MVSTQRGWKLLGLAGVVGVAATGALIARNERERRAYTPDEVRARLHERAAEAVGGPGRHGGSPPTPPVPTFPPET